MVDIFLRIVCLRFKRKLHYMWRCVMYCCLFQRANVFTHWHKLYHAVMVELFPSILSLISFLCPDLWFTLILPIISSFQAFHFSPTAVSATELCCCISKFIWPRDSKICLHWTNCQFRVLMGLPTPWSCVCVFVIEFMQQYERGNDSWSLLIIMCVYCYWYCGKEVSLF